MATSTSNHVDSGSTLGYDRTMNLYSKYHGLAIARVTADPDWRLSAAYDFQEEPTVYDVIYWAFFRDCSVIPVVRWGSQEILMDALHDDSEGGMADYQLIEPGNHTWYGPHD